MSETREVVLCKNCKHRPKTVVLTDGRAKIVGPDYKNDVTWWDYVDETCPYLCSDPYYNRTTPDDGFCHLGEPKEDNNE